MCTAGVSGSSMSISISSGDQAAAGEATEGSWSSGSSDTSSPSDSLPTSASSSPPGSPSPGGYKPVIPTRLSGGLRGGSAVGWGAVLEVAPQLSCPPSSCMPLSHRSVASLQLVSPSSNGLPQSVLPRAHLSSAGGEVLAAAPPPQRVRHLAAAPRSSSPFVAPPAIVTPSGCAPAVPPPSQAPAQSQGGAAGAGAVQRAARSSWQPPSLPSSLPSERELNKVVPAQLRTGLVRYGIKRISGSLSNSPHAGVGTWLREISALRATATDPQPNVLRAQVGWTSVQGQATWLRIEGSILRWLGFQLACAGEAAPPQLSLHSYILQLPLFFLFLSYLVKRRQEDYGECKKQLQVCGGKLDKAAARSSRSALLIFSYNFAAPRAPCRWPTMW